MPEPYYSEPGITIYHGDAREILPQLDVAVESVVTSQGNGTGHPAARQITHMRCELAEHLAVRMM